jgi:phenylacetate-CoA ligase
MIQSAWHLWRQLRAERWPLSRLRALQLEGLERLVRTAHEQVPFYRSLFDAAGVGPRDIRELDDVRKLPLVDKAMMRAAPESERVTRTLGRAAETVRISTSGSSGTPFEFLIDRSYDVWRKAQCLRPYVTNGRLPGQRVLRLTRYAEGPGSRSARAGIFPERRVSSVAPPEEMLAALRAYRPHDVQGYPSALRLLAVEARRSRAPIPRVRRIFSDSERLSPDTRDLLESVFGAPVVDVYGSWEADNVAYECRWGRGMHVALDSVIAEVVEEDRPAPVGAEGELVLTVLHNRFMPFIRYRTGDLARWLPESCPCGRTFPLLQLLGGRRYDMIRRADGAEVSAMALVGSFAALAGSVDEFRIVQKTATGFLVEVVPAADHPVAAIERRVKDLVAAQIPGATTEVEVVSRIPRTEGGKLLPFSSRVQCP